MMKTLEVKEENQKGRKTSKVGGEGWEPERYLWEELGKGGGYLQNTLYEILK